MSLFLEKWRGEHPDAGGVGQLQALRAWRELSEAERAPFEAAARERGDAARAQDQSVLVQRQRELAARAPPAPASDLSKPPEKKRKRAKADGEARPAVPQPLFPARQAPAPASDTRTAAELAEAIRAQAAAVAPAASLDDIARQLNAPRLTCDWQDPARDASSDEGGDEALAVEKPPEVAARQLLHEGLQQRISAMQMQKVLEQRDSAKGELA